MTHGHLFDLCLLYPHSHLPTFQTTSFLARALFCLPAGPLLGAASHTLAGAILSKCHGDHSTSCLKPSVTLLTAFRVKYIRHFRVFQALHDCLPFQAHSIPFCCECSVLWSFWMVSHPLLPLHWFSPLPVLSYHLHTTAQSLKCLWSFRAQLMHPSPSLGWEPLLRVPQPPGLPFQVLPCYTRDSWPLATLVGVRMLALMPAPVFQCRSPNTNKFYLMTIQGDRPFITPRCCCQCPQAQLWQRPGMGPGSPGAQRPLRLAGGQ